MRIRSCGDDDLEAMLDIVEDASRAYVGVIPADCWREPYMSAEELVSEIAAGVRFHGCESAGRLLGVMGIQDVGDVMLIRHAYVRTAEQGRGIGSALLDHLLALAERPVLVGTWAAASWAVRFYQGHGFTIVTRQEKDRLLRKYWDIPERQVETSVVLAGDSWRESRDAAAESIA